MTRENAEPLGGDRRAPVACQLRGHVPKRCGMHRVRYSVVVSYQPMSLAELARFTATEPDFSTRWRLVVEF
jgi:hypothetical protein